MVIASQLSVDVAISGQRLHSCTLTPITIFHPAGSHGYETYNHLLSSRQWLDNSPYRCYRTVFVEYR